MDIRRKDEVHGGRRGGGAPARAGGGRVVKAVLIILVIAALVVLGFYFSDKNTSFDDGPVAIVNGEEISGSELEAQLESLRNSANTQAEQFNALSNTRQQEILLEGIINTRLQLQAAEASGVTVSDEEVESELQAQIDLIGEDVFAERLRDNDVTRQEVANDLRNQMIIGTYIEREAGGQLTATDLEVQDLYDQYVSQVQQVNGTSTEEAVPTLDELRPQIEAAVIQQKQQQIATQLLQQAREGAEVEVLIEGVNYPASTEAAPVTTTNESETSAPISDGTETTPEEQ